MKQRLGLGLAAARCVFGALGLLAPVTTQRLSLLDAGDDTAAVTGWRFFGTRALGLGIAYLTADEPTRRHLDRAGLVVDGLDTAFLAVMAVRKRIAPGPALWLAAITGGAAAIDIANIISSARSLEQDDPSATVGGRASG